MRNKIVSFLTVLSLCAAFWVMPAKAAISEDDGITALLNELEIMQGDENGDMMLDKKVSRAEFAKIAVAASPNKNSVAVGLRQSPFKDVPYSMWYAPYVKASVSAGYVVGYLDATFRPENTVTYEEAATIMIRVLGYDDSSFSEAYPYGQLSKAQSLDLLDDVGGEIGEELTRYQVMRMVYNALCATMNSSQSKLITVHECAMTENADIIATNVQDDSLGEDKVYTSAGTYTKGEYFSNDSAGMTGTIYVKNGRDLVAFVPDSKTQNDYDTYFIYSVLPNSTIVGYKNGYFEEINIPDSATVYNGQTRTTYAQVKGALEMGDTLYIKHTPNGSVDYVTYDTNNLEGPVKVTSDSWLSSLGANSQSTVFRSGVESSAAAVQTNDIVYYSAPLDVVFAYTDKVTGVYEKASPTKDSPETVTVSGKDYKVESVEAFRDLSSSGAYKYGDTVTILLGRTGEVAGVAGGSAAYSAVTNTSSLSGSSAGFVIETGKKDFANADNTVYSSYYAKVVTADGSVNEYPTTSNPKSYLCSVVNVNFKNGKATLSKSNSAGNVSGVVDASAGTIGSSKLADSVSILDTVGTYSDDVPLYSRVYPQRIDGINIASSRILYSSRNSAGEIDKLILSDVTGDAYSYGLITKRDKATGAYTIDIDGNQSIVTGFSTSATGAHKFIMSAGTMKKMQQLATYSGNISSLSHSEAVIGSKIYKLSDKVVVYQRTDASTYMKIPLDTAINGNYRMTAYYDKSEDTGGRIRIIVAQSK